MCRKADLVLSNAGQDGVVGTPKILRGNLNHESLYSINLQENLKQKMGKLDVSIF